MRTSTNSDLLQLEALWKTQRPASRNIFNCTFEFHIGTIRMLRKPKWWQTTAGHFVLWPTYHQKRQHSIGVLSLEITHDHREQHHHLLSDKLIFYERQHPLRIHYVNGQALWPVPFFTACPCFWLLLSHGRNLSNDYFCLFGPVFTPAASFKVSCYA